MSTKAETAAKVLRVATVPPLILTVTILLLSVLRPDLFHDASDVVVTILCIGLIPMLAYPLQHLIPSLKDTGRHGQRLLAFILTFIGYAIAVIRGYTARVDSGLQLIYNSFLLSVILLTLVNKLSPIRASGHACSVTGPLVYLIAYVGPVFILPSILVAAGVVWSSLKLKRHTPRDLAMGALVFLAAFGINLLLMPVLIP